MASIISRGDGRRSIQFSGLDGKRRTVSLGKSPAKDAKAIATKIEAILASHFSQRPLDIDVAKWIAELPIPLADKLAAAGILAKRPEVIADERPKLKRFLDAYLLRRTDVKGSTKIFYGHTIRNLIAFFGESKPLAEITLGDGDDFRRYLLKQSLSQNTICRRCGLARTLFRDAMRRKLITENPFADLNTVTRSNPARQRYIAREVILAVLELCPDAEWRLIVALSRFAGLRIPSEALTLRWSDINWKDGRVTVHSPKTEHHEGKETRVIPLFPSIRRYFEDAFEVSPEGSQFVFNKLRRHIDQKATGWKAVNLRTTFTKIVKRAGFEPWPKLWHNLRASAETDLAEEFPMHVVCKWLGHGRLIAQEHYLQVTDDHYERAAKPVQCAAPALQQTTEKARNVSQAVSAQIEKPVTLQQVATVCENLQKIALGDTGFEPVTSTV
jgi:integrase